jgi:hypothetical protein
MFLGVSDHLVSKFFPYTQQLISSDFYVCDAASPCFDTRTDALFKPPSSPDDVSDAGRLLSGDPRYQRPVNIALILSRMVERVPLGFLAGARFSVHWAQLHVGGWS